MNSGFTLIELLVIVSIISLLSVISMTYMQGPKLKARNVSFQSTAKAIQASVGVCCGGNNSGSLLSVAGGPVCSTDSTSSYPGAESVGTIMILRDCTAIDGFSFRLTPGTKNNSGQISYAECDRDGCEFVAS